MAENLIYGKSVRDFGAIGDGKADDTNAFINAFEKESLISIPAGHYKINKELVISSGKKIVSHSQAIIDFCGIISSEIANNISISGGEWNNISSDATAFEFENASNITVENCKISSKSDCIIGMLDAKNIFIENVEFTSETTSSAIVFGGECEFVLVKGCTCKEKITALEFAKNSSVKNSHFDNTVLDGSDGFLIASNSLTENCGFNGITGKASENAVFLEHCSLNNVFFRNISVYDGYFSINNCNINRTKIEHFKRLIKEETGFSKPSIKISGASLTLICDGIPLDAIILAKKSVPDVKMTAAKMSLPYPTYNNYTLELSLSEKDSFIVPTGDFESMEFILNND